MKITDFKIRLIDKDSMLASFEINFDYVLTIKEILLFQTKDGNGLFISVPAKQFKDKETGDIKYRDYIEFSPQLKEYLRKFCNELYQKEKMVQCSLT